MKSRTISTQLTIMNMFVSLVALLVAGIVFFAYDWITFRESLVRNLSIQAEIAGLESVSALLFNDPNAAERTLHALRADPSVVSAVIKAEDGERFAVYHRNGSRTNVALGPATSEAHLFTSNEVTVARTITSDGKPIGTVYIQSDLKRRNDRVSRYVVIILIVLGISSLAALIVSSFSRRAISQPIAGLADVALSVSRMKDYSVRATPSTSARELKMLIDGFNEMLSQIQERDKALQRGRDELEERVRERTVQLETVNKELEAFSYSVSHDLRAPLRHIDGFSSMLSERYGQTLDPTAQRYLDCICHGAKQMGQLIDDLLDMARITRKEMVRTSSDINKLVRTVVGEVAQEAPDRRIEWRITPLPTLNCDPGLMKIVFTNLLSNAVKYTRNTQDAVVEVGEFNLNGTRGVFVKDNGAGFDQQFVHKLFGVFQRLHRADEFEGTGVGLATVRRIIERHGGRIWAEGQVGKGAAFYFTLDSEPKSNHEANRTEEI